MTGRLLLVLALFAAPATAFSAEHRFALPARAEVVVSITASCARCDWATAGREAALLEVTLDGAYSQHVVLTHTAPRRYRIMLGRLARGNYQLTVRQDPLRSARNAGVVAIGEISVETFTEGSAEFEWLSRAPFLHARPGTVERFSDLPLLSYVEAGVPGGEGGHDYRLQYTTIFSNEDGGTPPDRLMATWGRTTDIEFLLGVTSAGRELIQAEGHAWVDFRGRRIAGHPALWVATDNNMVADRGPGGLVRFGLAPVLVNLVGTSRETMMDREPWTYGIAAAEMRREGRIDSAGQPRAGAIADPRRYAVVEACADVVDAMLAIDVGVKGDGATRWFATDARDERFKIGRGGCFRGGVALPPDAGIEALSGVRIRAFPRPGATGSPGVVVRRVYPVVMLDSDFAPEVSPLHWAGATPLPVDGSAVEVPLSAGP